MLNLCSLTIAGRRCWILVNNGGTIKNNLRIAFSLDYYKFVLSKYIVYTYWVYRVDI